MGGNRGRILPTTPEGAALFHPVRGNAPLSDFGAPVRCLRTGRLLLFDPWQTRVKKETVAPTFFQHGTLGSGKTATSIFWAAMLGGLQAGIRRGGREAGYMKVRINDRKLRGEVEEDVEPGTLLDGGEYVPFARKAGYDIINLNEEGLFNIFDHKMMSGWHDVISIAVNVCEMNQGRSPLPIYQRVALQVAAWKMLNLNPEALSIGVYSYTLRNLSIADVDAYYEEIDTKVFEKYPGLREELKLQAEKPENVDEREFMYESRIAANSLTDLVMGEYGGVFGDDRSLYDALSGDRVALNWFGVNDEAASIMDAVMMKWQTAALVRGDRSIIPDIEITDEAHNALKRIMYVRFYVELLKVARMLKTARFINTQSGRDITMHADDGSAIAKLASGLRDAIGGYFFFQLKSTPENIDMLRDAGLSRQDAFLNFMLPPGCFAFKASRRSDTLFLQVLPGSTLWRLIQTDAASEGQINRRPILSFPGMTERAAKLAALRNSEAALAAAATTQTPDQEE